MMKYMLGLFLLLFSCITFADTTVIHVISTSPQFTITEPSNPTTGYSWKIESYDPRFLGLISATYEAPKSNLMGAAGNMVWVFKAKPGVFGQVKQTQIRLVYARPWNPNDNPTHATVDVFFDNVIKQ